MKKRKFIALLSISMLILCTFVLKFISDFNSSFVLKKDSNYSKHSNLLSMMLETGEGTGDYKTATSSTWPTVGYKFNSERSGCENGSSLSWDDNKKVVVFS